MRLIDANKLLEEIKTLPIMSNWGESFLPQLVQEQPTVDAVAVIRCKDCKYNRGDNKCLNPDSFFAVPADDDFCSYGERNGT